MTPRAAAILTRLRAAESEFHQDLVDQAARWGFTHDRRSVRFPPDLQRAHRALKPRLWTFLKAARPLPLLTAPLIYSVALPFLLLDVWMTVYQWVCFPVYGIPRVRRRDYLVIDHQHLAYLNAVEKVHCMYCGYANGLIAYCREIAARTEQYWCPIKHATPIPAPHNRYCLFVDYGDAEGYRRSLDGLRQALTSEHTARAVEGTHGVQSVNPPMASKHRNGETRTCPYCGQRSTFWMKLRVLGTDPRETERGGEPRDAKHQAGWECDNPKCSRRYDFE